MIAMTMTMPLAKLPIWCQRPRSETSIVRYLREGRLLGEREGERLLDHLLHLPPADLRGIEAHVGQHVSDSLREQLVTRLEDLEGVHLGVTGRVHDELCEHLAFDVRRLEHVRVPRLRGARRGGDLLL